MRIRIEGNEVKELREHRDMEQGELATVVGVTQATISRIEQDGGTTKATAVKIAKALGVDLSEIWTQAAEDTVRGKGRRPEQKMQFHRLSPETLELMAGVQEILDSGVETVVSALKASIHAFRISARALRREGDRKRAKGAAAMGGQE